MRSTFLATTALVLAVSVSSAAFAQSPSKLPSGLDFPAPSMRDAMPAATPASPVVKPALLMSPIVGKGHHTVHHKKKVKHTAHKAPKAAAESSAPVADVTKSELPAAAPTPAPAPAPAPSAPTPPVSGAAVAPGVNPNPTDITAPPPAPAASPAPVAPTVPTPAPAPVAVAPTTPPPVAPAPGPGGDLPMPPPPSGG